MALHIWKQTSGIGAPGEAEHLKLRALIQVIGSSMNLEPDSEPVRI